MKPLFLFSAALIAIAILGGSAWIGHQLCRIADCETKREALDFQSCWEIGFICKDWIELAIRTEKGDSAKAVIIEHQQEYLKQIGKWRAEQRWSYKQDQKMKDKLEKWFDSKETP